MHELLDVKLLNSKNAASIGHVIIRHVLKGGDV